MARVVRPRIGRPTAWWVTAHAARRYCQRFGAPSPRAAQRAILRLLASDPPPLRTGLTDGRRVAETPRGRCVLVLDYLDRRVVTVFALGDATAPREVPGALPSRLAD